MGTTSSRRESGLTSLGCSVTREPWPTDSGGQADMSAAEMLAGAAPERASWRTVRRLQVRIVKVVAKRPRPARGVRECLSWMRGNSHVQFLGEGVAVTPPPYPAKGVRSFVRPRPGSLRGGGRELPALGVGL